jgi:hypothetical protein
VSALPQFRRSSELPVRAGHSLAAHESMVNGHQTASEGNSAENQTASDGNLAPRPFPSVNLREAILIACNRVGLTQTVAAERMSMSLGQWSKQMSGTDGHHIAIDRLVDLGLDFMREFLPFLNNAAGLVTTHDEIAELQVLRVIGHLRQAQAEAEQILVGALVRGRRIA